MRKEIARAILGPISDGVMALASDGIRTYEKKIYVEDPKVILYGLFKPEIGSNEVEIKDFMINLFSGDIDSVLMLYSISEHGSYGFEFEKIIKNKSEFVTATFLRSLLAQAFDVFTQFKKNNSGDLVSYGRGEDTTIRYHYDPGTYLIFRNFEYIENVLNGRELCSGSRARCQTVCDRKLDPKFIFDYFTINFGIFHESISESELRDFPDLDLIGEILVEARDIDITKTSIYEDQD